jgi:ribonuclease HI
MELQAVIEGLRALREPCAVTVHTDSQYVQRGITEWVPVWKDRGWRKTGKGGTVLNRELWEELDKLVQLHKVEWKWIKGHSNNRENLRCDFLANRAAREQISSSKS